jgi:glutamate dehydrogenase
VARIVRGWSDELKQNLVGHYGEERGNRLLRRYAQRNLPLSYQERVTPASAVSDLERLEAAEQSGRVEVKLSAAQGDDGAHQHLKLFRRGRPRPLVGDPAGVREHGTDGAFRAAVQPAQE